MAASEDEEVLLLIKNPPILTFFNVCFLLLWWGGLWKWKWIPRPLSTPGASQVTQWLKDRRWGIGSLGGEDPLEEEMATRSSILAWKIPRTEEPGGLQSLVLLSQAQLSTHKHTDNLSNSTLSSHVRMWEVDHKEGWAPKNWCFWTVVLEKTLENPLDFKEISPEYSLEGLMLKFKL